MKSILIYGGIMGVLLIFNEDLVGDILRYIFDTIEIYPWGLRFVIICSSILFATNHFLKYDRLAKKYNYAMGFGVGLGCSIIGVSMYSFYYVLTNPPSGEVYYSVYLLKTFLGQSKEILLYSLFMPLFFIRQKEKKKISQPDILDDELD